MASHSHDLAGKDLFATSPLKSVSHFVYKNPRLLFSLGKANNGFHDSGLCDNFP
jgi:hypothetical protein